MSKYLVLYNPNSKGGKGQEDAKRIENFLTAEDTVEYKDSLELYHNIDLVNTIPEDVRIVFTGGDGTVNRVVNFMSENAIKRTVYYFPAGSGNDFIIDLDKKKNCTPFAINDYMEHLPEVHVNGIVCKFVNGIGYGLDGYCCEEKDRLNAVGKNRSYTMIAFLGMLGKFKPVHAKITVDGEMREYDNLYMAPTMFGRHYGGGVKITPMQNRHNPEHTVTSAALVCKSRLKLIPIFLMITQGLGEKIPKTATYRQGKHVKVEFDRPVALQIDGETVLNVTEYEVFAAKD